jgi:phage-related protein (TIGR01555 family)
VARTANIKTKAPRTKAVAHVDTVSPTLPPEEVSPRFDGWGNVFTGLGGANDKTSYTKYGTSPIIDDDSLSLIYMGDGLGGRIIDVIADDMTREWIYLGEDEGDDGDSKAQEVIDELQRLNAEEIFNLGIKWQRLYGGAIIIIGAMDGQSPDKPLNVNRVKTIEYLKVVDRTNIPITECIFDKNPASPTFGQVMVYKVNYYVGSEIIPMFVHHTRVIALYNDPVPSRMRGFTDVNLRHWGMSSLQRIYEELRDLGAITQSTVNIMMEFIIGKYKIKHLAEMLAAGQEQKVVKRVEVMNRSKSVINAVLLGDDEEYTRDYATLAGLPEVIDRFMLKLSGSTGIPVTRLFGRSPAGLNATGENDLRNYYDLIEANQRNKLLAPIRSLVATICAYKKIATVPEVTFNSLYQLSEEEQSKVDKTYAEIEKIKADTELIYVNMGAKDVLDVSKEHDWEPPEAEEFDDPEMMEVPVTDPKTAVTKKPVDAKQQK